MADEHVVINVEAQIAQRLHLQSQDTALRAQDLRYQAEVAMSAVAVIDDPVEQARARENAERISTAAMELERAAEAQKFAAVNVLTDAESIDTEGKDHVELVAMLEALQPVSHRPVTDEERQERAEAAAQHAVDVMRAERSARLAASDWTQMLDAPVDREAWAAYRQQLRDLPETADPANVEWPEPPA